MTSKKSKDSLKSELNKLFCYSGNDFENPISDKLVDVGFKKIEIRTMKSTSPNRKQGVEETGKEILYLK